MLITIEKNFRKKKEIEPKWKCSRRRLLGNLAVRAPALGGDEIGESALALNDFLQHLHASIGEIGVDAEKLRESASELSDSSRLTADSSVRQSQSAGEVAATVQNSVASIESINDHAGALKDIGICRWVIC